MAFCEEADGGESSSEEGIKSRENVPRVATQEWTEKDRR